VRDDQGLQDRRDDSMTASDEAAARQDQTAMRDRRDEPGPGR
jgi:hypothetical protein